MEFLPLSSVKALRNWQKWVVLSILSGLYILVFLLFFPQLGPSMVILSFLPVGWITWYFGLPIGLLAGALAMFLNTLLLNTVGIAGWDAAIRRGGIPTSFTVFVTVLVVSIIRSFNVKLHESEERTRQLSDAAFEALVIHDKGIILDVNQSFCRMYGYQRSEAIGISALQLTAPEEREVVRQRIMTGDIRSYEGVALRKDGTTFCVRLMGKPMTYKGRMVRITAIRDITESAQTRHDLDVERIILRTLIGNLPHRVYYKDTKGCFVLVNSVVARSYKLSSVTDAVGTSVFDYYPHELAAKYHADDMAVIGSSTPLFNREEASIDENGHRIWLLTNKVPVVDEGGHVIGLIGISIDITEHKLAQTQQLELTLAEKKTTFLREFLSTVSHDLKTPLTILDSSIYLLERITDPEAQKSKLAIIKSQTLHLSKLIQDILEMSHLETVRDLTMRPLDVNLILCDAEAMFRPITEQKHIILSLHLSEGLPHILVNKMSLNRVFVNLIENALNYTPSNGTVSIKTYTQQNEIVVEVGDTGIGIGEEDLARIFEPFFRADKARATHTGGTGLGLAIVKNIIELHGGSIQVSSQVGVGTTFQIRLPIRTRIAP